MVRIPSTRQIIALWLQDVEGLSEEQIARQMKTTVPAVKGLLYRIRHNTELMNWLPGGTRERQRHRTRAYGDYMKPEVKRNF